MTKWRFIIMVALGLGVWQGYAVVQKKNLDKKMQAVQNTPVAHTEFGAPQSCAGKKLCITVYVAPWCGACKISQPTFKALNAYLPKYRSEVGFGVVVGGASPHEHQAEQQKLTPVESYADDQGVVLKNRGIRAFPTWIINDSTGKELVRKSGGLNISSDAEIEMLLAQFLQI